MPFWLLATSMAALVAAILVLGPLRGRGAAAPAASHDLQVYRDQLAEIDRDLARGVLAGAEADRARTEVSRRILEADRAEGRAGGPGRAPALATGVAVVAVAALVVAGSAALYARLGAPGMADQPRAARIAAAAKMRADRPSQADAVARAGRSAWPEGDDDPRHAALVTRLREVLAARPGDARGLALLAEHEAALGNYSAAVDAQERLVAAKGDDATAPDYARLAHLRVTEAGGYVSPEAEDALAEALTRDRSNGTARYYAGLLDAQTGRPDRAFRRWRRLLEQGPEGAPWIAPIRARITAVAARAGIRYRPPAPAPGPDAGAIAAAEEMSPEARQQMIRGMVSGLADRLQDGGGSAAEWARLIGAYGVLGESGKQAAALEKAKQRFAGDAAALDRLDRAAARAAMPAAGARDAMPAAAGGAPDGDTATVRRLSERLSAEGGPPEDWAALIATLGRLDRGDRAHAIWQEAREVFAGEPAALARLREAASAAGLLE